MLYCITLITVVLLVMDHSWAQRQLLEVMLSIKVYLQSYG